jgi:hypothetical protein
MTYTVHKRENKMAVNLHQRLHESFILRVLANTEIFEQVVDDLYIYSNIISTTFGSFCIYFGIFETNEIHW